MAAQSTRLFQECSPCHPSRQALIACSQRRGCPHHVGTLQRIRQHQHHHFIISALINQGQHFSDSVSFSVEAGVADEFSRGKSCSPGAFGQTQLDSDSERRHLMLIVGTPQRLAVLAGPWGVQLCRWQLCQCATVRVCPPALLRNNIGTPDPSIKLRASKASENMRAPHARPDYRNQTGLIGILMSRRLVAAKLRDLNQPVDCREIGRITLGEFAGRSHGPRFRLGRQPRE